MTQWQREFSALHHSHNSLQTQHKHIENGQQIYQLQEISWILMFLEDRLLKCSHVTCYLSFIQTNNMM